MLKFNIKTDIKHLNIILFIPFVSIFFVNIAFGQAEVEPWGNIKGIRKHGQLFEFETYLRVVSEDSTRTASTAKEKQRPHFKRDGNKQIVTSNIDSLF